MFIRSTVIFIWVIKCCCCCCCCQVSSCFYDRFARYVEGEHFSQCPPETIASGLAKLPLAYGYKDGSADTNIVATQRLPNGQQLVGKDTYKSLMRFFTTFDITPEDLREKAQKRLDELLSQVIILVSLKTSQMSHQARAYPGFCSMKRLNNCYSPSMGC